MSEESKEAALEGPRPQAGEAGRGNGDALPARVTVAQREKLERLGGAEWVRGKIDKAMEPNLN